MKKPKSRKEATEKAQILVVDDHPMTRLGVTRLIKGETDLNVLGEADSVEQALAALKFPLPHLILTDLNMPGRSGLEFIHYVHHHHPNVPMLVLSMHDETIFAERALRAGARGYVMKKEGGKRLLDAIRRVLRGGMYVSDSVSTHLLDSLAKNRPDRKTSEFSVLTDREFEVFCLLSQAAATEEISRRLCISGKTVETHRAHIREKLKLKSGMEVRKYAVRWGAAQGMI